MASTNIDVGTAMQALQVLEEMVDRQRAKVREVARRIHPGLSDDDLRNVQDFPDVCEDPVFQFEDGQLRGLAAAALTMKSRLIGATVARG